MKKVYAIFLLIMLLIVLTSDGMLARDDDGKAAEIVKLYQSKKMKLVFKDDFSHSVDGRPDTAYWHSAARKPYLWARWIKDGKDVAYISRGKLVCRAIPTPLSESDTARMQTGAIESLGKYHLRYGKVEVRMRTNNSEGNFPAVWMMPVNSGNPFRYGEIDIIEFFGNEGKTHQTVHNHRTFTMNKKDAPNSFSVKIDATRWHVYGVLWTPRYMAFFVDGELTGYYEKSTDPKLLEEGQWTFDREYYLILNQSVGREGWHEPHYDEVYETEYDWIRVYQVKE